MKAYTDIEQSKKLAEILPLESADLWWAERYTGTVKENGEYIVNETPFYYRSLVQPSATNCSQDTINDIPCWSLAALLDVLPSATLDTSDDHHCRLHCMERYTEWYDNAVDACVAMIERLHKQKLL